MSEMDFLTLVDLIRSDGSIIINKNLNFSIGTNETIIYSELLSKYIYFAKEDKLTDDGYFYCKVDDLTLSTGIKDDTQRTTINNLIDLGLIKQDNRGVPPVRHFKIIPDTELINKLMKKGRKEIKKLEKELKEEEKKDQKRYEEFRKKKIAKNADMTQIPENSRFEGKKEKSTMITDIIQIPKNSRFKCRKFRVLNVENFGVNNTNINNTNKLEEEEGSSSKNKNSHSTESIPCENFNSNNEKIPEKVKAKYKQAFPNKELSINYYKKLRSYYDNKKILLYLLDIAEIKADKPAYLEYTLKNWQEKKLNTLDEIKIYVDNGDYKKSKSSTNSKNKTSSNNDKKDNSNKDNLSEEEVKDLLERKKEKEDKIKEIKNNNSLTEVEKTLKTQPHESELNSINAKLNGNEDMVKLYNNGWR